MVSLAVLGAAHIHLRDALAVVSRRDGVSVDLVVDHDGIPCFVEKPLALTPVEARSLWSSGTGP